jgi:transposase InsO family protein
MVEGIQEVKEHHGFTAIIMNPGYTELSLRKGAVLGSFHVVQESNICAINLTAKTVLPTFIAEEKKRYMEQNLKLDGFPEAVRQKFKDLIFKYHDIFSANAFDLGRTDVISHAVHLQHKRPIHVSQFRIPWEHKGFLDDYADELLNKNCIQASRSPYNAPVFCVKKPHGGGLRVVQDFRHLNMASFEDKYIIREVQDCIDTIGLRGSTIFSSLDLTSGFWQQNLEESSRPYTAFTIPGRGRFEWVTTPMGLHGSPASFARLMDFVMKDLPGVLTYIDDILAHSPDYDTHLLDLEQSFQRLRQYNLKLNLKKCAFGAKEVCYLGFMLTPQGVLPGAEKLEAVKNFPIPQTETQIREFTGLANYFRHFIPRYAMTAGYLTSLTQKENPWKGGPLPAASLEAFYKLRDALCAAPVLAYPRGDLPFILTTDAATGDANRPGGLGAVLTQKYEDGQERVIGYASRSLKTHEKNYSAFLLEMAAASWGIDHFSVYLTGRKFTLCTDHRPLEKLSGRHEKTMCRLEQQMLEYNFIIQYKPGPENVVADALSRNISVDSLSPDVTQLLHPRSIAKCQKQDKLCRDVREALKTRAKLADRWTAKLVDSCFLRDDIIFYLAKRRHFVDASLILVPHALRLLVLKEAHDSITGGHAGIEKTTCRIMQKYWWPHLLQDVTEYLDKCLVCAKSKNPYRFRTGHAPMQPLQIPKEPNMRLHVDLFGPLKDSERGKKYILVMTDAYSKYAVLVALPDKMAETVGQAIFDSWICRFSVPHVIVSDQGTEFCNRMAAKLYEALGVKHHKTASFHPQTNSAAESFNRTIIKYLTRMIDTNTLDWEKWLPALTLSYNTQVHKTTFHTPFYLTYLREHNLPYFDLEKRLYNEDWPDVALHRLRQTQKLCMENAVRAQKAMSDRAESSEQYKTLKVGDKILLNFPQSHFPDNGKFAQKWIEGREIVEKLGEHTFKLGYSAGRGRHTIVHEDRLKLKPDELQTAAPDARIPPSPPNQPTSGAGQGHSSRIYVEDDSDPDPTPPLRQPRAVAARRRASVGQAAEARQAAIPPAIPAPLAAPPAAPALREQQRAAPVDRVGQLAWAVFGNRTTRASGQPLEVPWVIPPRKNTPRIQRQLPPPPRPPSPPPQGDPEPLQDDNNAAGQE